MINLIPLEEIKERLAPAYEIVKNELEKIQSGVSKSTKVDYGRYCQIVLSKLRLILGNQERNATMRRDIAEQYYFNEENGLEHIQERYQLIIELQDDIVTNTCIPFIYDRFTILKLLQITADTYNTFISDCENGINAYNEDIANLFLDIETMILNDRNTGAENGTKNAKAVDIVNRYKKKNGGFGVQFEESTNADEKKPIMITVEEAQRKINEYGFTNLLNNK